MHQKLVIHHPLRLATGRNGVAVGILVRTHFLYFVCIVCGKGIIMYAQRCGDEMHQYLRRAGYAYVADTTCKSRPQSSSVSFASCSLLLLISPSVVVATMLPGTSSKDLYTAGINIFSTGYIHVCTCTANEAWSTKFSSCVWCCRVVLPLVVV